MQEIASTGQLRQSFFRWALLCVPAVMLLGSLSGVLSGSGADDPWYASLSKPEWTPPGVAFGIVWPILYILMGLALAMVVNARNAKGRTPALLVFAAMFATNLLWSPVFFGQHQIATALMILFSTLALTVATAVLFWRIRPLAGAMLLPLVAWLAFAGALNKAIVDRNPNHDPNAVTGPSTSIQLAPPDSPAAPTKGQ